MEGGIAEGTTDGTDIIINAQDGGPDGGAGGNIVLIPGTGTAADEFGNPIPNNGNVIVAGNIAPSSDDVNSVGTPELRYKDIYLGSNIHYVDDGLFFMFDFLNARNDPPTTESIIRGVFTWDGKFGIGTDLPTEQLHVIGNVMATGNVDAVSFTGDGSALTGTTAAVTAEISARAAADTTLQNNIDAEEAARIAADGTEATSRAAADTTLQNNITAEETARIAAVAASDGAIAANAGNLTQEISDRIADVDAEEAARLAAVAASDGAIATNAGNLTQEIADRIADVDAEEAARLAAVAASDGAIAANAGDITQEIADRIADVDAEETARLAAVAASDGSIAANAGNLTQEIADRIADVDAEEAARIAADNTLQSNINAEATARGNADTTHTTNIGTILITKRN